MTVNEDLWIGKCPQCLDENPNVQVPITLGTPPQCHDCDVNPWKGKGNYEEVIYYLCQDCGCRYLTPKIEPKDILLYQQGKEP